MLLRRFQNHVFEYPTEMRETVGRGIAIRAKLEETGREIFISVS